MSEWVIEWVSERVIDWLSEWAKESASEWVSGWVDLVSEWVSEWVSERMNMWMSDYISKQKAFQQIKNIKCGGRDNTKKLWIFFSVVIPSKNMYAIFLIFIRKYL